MLRKADVLLLCCLLMTLCGCEKSGTTQTSTTSQTETTQVTTTQATASPQASSSPGVNVVSDAPQPAPVNNSNVGGQQRLDACALITSAEIESVQGEPVKETKITGHSEGNMSVSQCFYSVATFSKSVSLAVTVSDPASPTQGGPKDFWEETFHRYDEKEREREKEKEREKGKEREKEKERARDKERKGEKEREKELEKEPVKERGGEEEEEEGTPPKKIKGVGDEAYWTGSNVGGALYVLKKNAFIRISVGGPGSEEDKINKSKALAQKALKRL